jgi:signal transduction histidine kinase
VENIAIDRKSVDKSLLQSAIQNPRSAIELQPGQSNIALEYTALSLTRSDQIKFRYRLEGLEENWVEAGTRRAVDYSYLPAGSYTFRVIAANANGVWNNDGAAMRIVVRPYFYQTWWFIGLEALALGLVVWIIYYTRVARLRAVAEAKTLFSRQLIESQEAERKRIASELHDGLGQSLVIIKNRAMLGLNKRGDRERVAKELNSISESAASALEEVREITNNLRPQLLDRLGLTKAIRAMLDKTAGVIDIDGEVDNIDDLFSENEEISVYRIIQESVNNVIKHSNASNAIVKVKRGSHEVSVKVQDNGRGFDTTEVDTERRNLGLVGLKERAQLLKGTIQIESSIGEGTTIWVVIQVGRGDRVKGG